MTWESICGFLDKDIPDVPYPSGNDPTEFTDRFKKLVKKRVGTAARNFLAVVAVPTFAAMSWYLLRTRLRR